MPQTFSQSLLEAQYKSSLPLQGVQSKRNRCYQSSPYAIDLCKNVLSSFRLKLFQRGFMISATNQSSGRHEMRSYNSPVYKRMLSDIAAGVLPHFPPDIESKIAIKYHNGCIVGEVLDYRFMTKHDQEPRVHRVLLKPTQASEYYKILRGFAQERWLHGHCIGASQRTKREKEL